VSDSFRLHLFSAIQGASTVQFFKANFVPIKKTKGLARKLPLLSKKWDICRLAKAYLNKLS
jgi:hypothetical protein